MLTPKPRPGGGHVAIRLTSLARGPSQAPFGFSGGNRLYEPWRETCTALHLYTQIVGKYRLARTPWINHSWQATFYVSAPGLTSSLVPDGSGGVEIGFDLLDHIMTGSATDGRRATVLSRSDVGRGVSPAFHRYDRIAWRHAGVSRGAERSTRPCSVCAGSSQAALRRRCGHALLPGASRGRAGAQALPNRISRQSKPRTPLLG